MKLFVIALNEEIRSELLNHFELKVINNSNYFFNKTNHEFALVFSDVGKVNATLNLTKAVCDLQTVDTIINIGSCGCANKTFKVLQTCLIENSQFLDVDLSMFGYELNQMRSNPKLFKTSDILNQQLKNIINFDQVNCTVGTSDSFISQNNYKKFTDIDNIDLIDMELTSLCSTSYKLNIKLASIKVISDSLFAENKSVDDYQTNQKIFSQMISDYILDIIKKINL